MNEEQRLVYIRGRLLQVEITLESMKVANRERETRGEALAYTENDFLELINEYGVNHNSLMTEILGR